MKFKLTAGVLSLAAIGFLTASIAFSATLQLTKIGALDLGGKTYTEWWYSDINPTFVGKAVGGASVSVVVADKTFNATANSSGDWTLYIPVEKGDYDVTVASASENYKFKLHLGQLMPQTTQTTASSSSVPATGSNQTTALSFGIGLTLMALYLYFYGSNRNHKVFEKEITSGN